MASSFHPNFVPSPNEGYFPINQTIHMKDKNEVQLIGKVASDPVSKHYESGHRVALSIMTMAGDGNGSRKPQPAYHNVVAWDDIADDAERMLSKGSRVRVLGRLQYHKYKDVEGAERTGVEIKATSIQLSDS